MKKFEAVFKVEDSQLQNGSYETKRKFKATNYAIAKRKAKKLEKCIFGKVELLKIQVVKPDGTV